MSEQPGSLRYPVTGSPTRRANDRRQSSGARRVGLPTALPFGYADDVIVTYTGGADTIPRGTHAYLWQGDQASSDTAAITALDLTASRYVIFTVVGSGKLYATPQESWGAASGAASVIGLEYSHWDGWQRWQMRKRQGPCLGFSPTIQLVAGGNAWGVATNTTSGTVDGPLGTGKMNAPTEAVFGPDGMLYFIDQGTPFIRYLNPNPVATPGIPTLGTSVVSLNRGAFRENAKVFALGPNGRFYFYVNNTDDTNTPQIVSANPDNSTGSFNYADGLTSLLGPASNMFVAPDNSCLYVPVPLVSTYSSFSPAAPGPAYAVLRIAINSDGTAGAATTYAGNHGIPVSLFPNVQGEDVAATSGQIGNSVNCYVAPNGDLYTLCNQTRMVRKVAFDTGHIRSITNHQPLSSGGTPVAGGYGGDGLPSFLLNDNSFQFDAINSVAVDTCKNMFIGDGQSGYPGGGTVDTTGLVRYVDTGGILHTLAGQYPDVDNNLPDATPVDALTRTLYGASWIAWGPDGSLYITSAFCDLSNVSVNAIYRIASSH